MSMLNFRKHNLFLVEIDQQLLTQVWRDLNNLVHKELRQQPQTKYRAWEQKCKQSDRRDKQRKRKKEHKCRHREKHEQREGNLNRNQQTRQQKLNLLLNTKKLSMWGSQLCSHSCKFTLHTQKLILFKELCRVRRRKQNANNNTKGTERERAIEMSAVSPENSDWKTNKKTSTQRFWWRQGGKKNQSL